MLRKLKTRTTSSEYMQSQNVPSIMNHIDSFMDDHSYFHQYDSVAFISIKMQQFWYL